MHVLGMEQGVRMMLLVHLFFLLLLVQKDNIELFLTNKATKETGKIHKENQKYMHKTEQTK